MNYNQNEIQKLDNFEKLFGKIAQNQIHKKNLKICYCDYKNLQWAKFTKPKFRLSDGAEVGFDFADSKNVGDDFSTHRFLQLKQENRDVGGVGFNAEHVKEEPFKIYVGAKRKAI